MNMIKRYSLVALVLVAATASFLFLLGTNEMEATDGEDALASNAKYEVATFAAGCFWCSEAVYQETDGVIDAISGYAGGTVANPTYEQVVRMQTDHREAVQLTYDPEVISYDELLTILWRTIDPTDDGGSFVDRGFSYTSAIFYHDDSQIAAATSSIAELEQSGRFDAPIVTPILPYTTFYPAEEYHQDFYKKSTERYKSYEANSGRAEYRQTFWAEIEGI